MGVEVASARRAELSDATICIPDATICILYASIRLLLPRYQEMQPEDGVQECNLP
jgi:hypothetical protein